jgi:hypothetical protein
MPLGNDPTYHVAHIRVLVIEDHGDDLWVEVQHRRGATRTFIDKDQLIGVVPETSRSAISAERLKYL